MGNVIIDNQRNIRHVDAAGYDIRSYQHTYLAVLEIEHHLVPLTLLQVTMHRARVNL